MTRRPHPTTPCGLLVVFALVANPGCEDSGDPRSTPEASSPPSVANPSTTWFRDATAESGIEFRHDSGARGLHRMPESLGSGCALFDADGDGDLDAYLLRGHDLDSGPDPATSGNRFYRNDGGGRFSDETVTSGLGDPGYGHGVAAGDVDGDGDLDLYLANLGEDRLFINDGTGRFTSAPNERFANDDGFSVAPCFVDFDADGDLDLYVARYMDWSPAIEIECRNAMGELDYCYPAVYGRSIPDRLLENDGAGGFRDVTAEAGLADVSGLGLAAAAADLDGDGLLDIYVANDKSPNRLWINAGDGTFREEAAIRGCATGLDGSNRASMSVSFVDLDRDGDFEIHVSNIRGEADGLFENRDGRFLDRAAAWGIAAATRARTRWAGRFPDLDLDGDPDLVIGCGRVVRQSTRHRDDRPYAEPDLLFTMSEKGRFEAEEAPWPESMSPEATHGIAMGDVDGDGFEDLLMISRDGPARLLLRTPSADTPRPVRIDLRTAAGAPAIGARITVETAAGDRDHVVDTAGGYASVGSHVLSVAGPVTGLRIRWPDGTDERRPGPFEPGTTVRIDRTES